MSGNSLITTNQMKRFETYLNATLVLSLFLNSCNSNYPMNEVKNHIKIIGHRGGGGRDLPENSLAGIAYGLEHNCDLIEIDVQQTADLVVVVNHDKTISRTTDGTGFIKNFTFDQLQQFTIEPKTGQTALNEKIPALDQVIKLINGKSKLLIEIKYGNKYYPNIEERVLELISSNDAQNWCIIQSFSTDILRKVHSLNTKIELQKVCIGKLPFISLWISNKIEIRKIERMDFIQGIAVHYQFINKDIIRTIHNANKQIHAWTVDNEVIVKKLAGLGVDGIITNYPDLNVFNQ